ncbi:MAG: hypothetical protein NXY57DRAFT_975480 [Lentinula lateritia]|uniref:Uncharacterized protein n=1 Tax=Lentinula lateritia TaxID=40482 RepID=A0ABQ8VAN6_9AGAR|nr:MAG: hypothetical protein NXY57DRAFT_975480 [Lentinula lateritia]KAJ4484503.1 hypothetical protein C8R41DRAFT_868617 [Lentinula lateritia]
MAQATTLLLIMLSLSSSPSFLTTFFGANALPIDPSATNSSSTESLGSRMFTPENAKQANFLLGYTYVNTEIGTDYNTATQFTAAHHFEPGPLGSVGKYLSPRPAQIHELIPGATMECIATAKKDLVMKYGPIFVDAEALKNQQTLEKFLTEHKFSPRSSILIAHSPDTERKGELMIFLPGIFISTSVYNPAHPRPELNYLSTYVYCRPVQMMAHQPFRAVAAWEELQPRLWPKGLTTLSTLKYPAAGH